MRARLLLTAATLLLATSDASSQTAAPAPSSEQQELQSDVATQIGNLYIVGATLRAQNRKLQKDLDQAELNTKKLDGMTKAKVDDLRKQLEKAKTEQRSCARQP